MSIKELVIGGVITVVIGGTAYTVSQADVVKNFANDTGLSEQEASEYVKGVNKDELVPYDELGARYVSDGQALNTQASEIDCSTYTYGWESETLSCDQGKAHLTQIANNQITLGESYKKLHSDSASKTDIQQTIYQLDTVNNDYQAEVLRNVIDGATLDEAKKTNSYNKAVLKAVLEQ
jgi:hypothetical protein